MSLDVYLTSKGVQNLEPRPAIFIRENGSVREISHDEWRERFPDREPVYAQIPSDESCHYSANITHNLNTMASEAGIYKELWRPEEIGITKAKQLIKPLQNGLVQLRAAPERFKAFTPANGWGSYDGLVEFVDRYLAACEAYPDADVNVSR